jgi:predicted ATP-grasp superfamily ATP-dependent carboligase
MRALIVDQCGNRAALPAARALWGAGWIVGVGCAPGHGLAQRSRAVARTHRMPAASAGAAELLQAVNRAIAEGGYEIVFSLDDVGVLALSEQRHALKAVFPYGEHSGIVRAFDKLELMREARRAGLPVPRTEVPAGERAHAEVPAGEQAHAEVPHGEQAHAEVPRNAPAGADASATGGAGELDLESFGDGPLVVKPRLTFLDGVNGHLRSRVISDALAAREAVQAMREMGAEPIVQEHLEGQLMAFTALTDRCAQIVARVQQVSDRIWPLDAGISARAHTVAVDEQLAAGAQRLLEGLGWLGLAQLQFVRGRDGIPRLLDFNGRFYGSLALALAAGINLPATWARMATERAVDPVPKARIGVRYQWLGGDVRAGCASTSGLARVGSVLGSAFHAAHSTHSIWCVTDPLPATAWLSLKLARWTPRRA